MQRVDLAGFDALLQVLARSGHELVGPVVDEAAIALGPISGLGDLPRGIGDEQEPGRYRLRPRGDDAIFGFAATAHSFKRELFPPRVPLFSIRRHAGELTITEPPRPECKVALIGVRACDLAALHVHDRVLRDGPVPDRDYTARRAGVFILAVHCGAPGGTCFCASMGTGPRVPAGFDLAATELLAPEHAFVVEIGSAAGAAALDQVPSRPARADELAAADQVVRSAATRMGRRLETDGLREILMARLEHPRWTEVAERCLGCASCTMVCPTCFCTAPEDRTDLGGDEATHARRWDSCFAADFAYVHGGSVRPSLRARYRQWLTHKLATWHDQFGTSGCVGCGRCVTWCPAGIDITEEVAAIRAPRRPSDA
jgi:ferredoxin